MVHGPLQIAHFHKTFEALEGSRSLRRKDYHIAPTLCGPSTALGMILPRALRTAVGHELRDQQITSALASKGDLGAAGQYRREWDGPAALPPPTVLRVRGWLVRAGAPPCLACPPFAQLLSSELIWVRTHFTWSASIRWVPRERVSRGRITLRLANLPPCLIGIEAGRSQHLPSISPAPQHETLHAEKINPRGS